MTIHNLANEVNRINGALEILGLLRERLTLQLDEMHSDQFWQNVWVVPNDPGYRAGTVR